MTAGTPDRAPKRKPQGGRGGPARRDGAGAERGGPSGRGGKPRRDDHSARGGGDDPVPGHVDGPRGAREPIGRDRATRRGDAPARPSRDRAAPPRPPLPDDEEPQLPRGVVKEIDRALGSGRRARDVALALSIGSAAIEASRPDIAVEVLAWAKHEAPRVSAVREAYGVALYLDEDFGAALTELQAYRRLTGRVDQNHLVADCLRALGRDVDRVAEAASPLLDDHKAPEDRRAEAAIVWAAALADAGDVRAGRAVLRRFLEPRRGGAAEHDLRVRWLAADLAQRDSDHLEAARQLERIVATDPDFLDARDRLEDLRDA